MGSGSEGLYPGDRQPTGVWYNLGVGKGDPMNKTFNCTACSATADALEEFPGGVCLTCWAASPEGQRMPTAAELTAMWGGKA